LSIASHPVKQIKTHPVDKQSAGTSRTGSQWAKPRVVLHQPLSCSLFWKKRVFRQKMNGPAVCLASKTENAPTWRSPNPVFGTPFWGCFPLFCPAQRLLFYSA